MEGVGDEVFYFMLASVIGGVLLLYKAMLYCFTNIGYPAGEGLHFSFLLRVYAQALVLIARVRIVYLLSVLDVLRETVFSFIVTLCGLVIYLLIPMCRIFFRQITSTWEWLLAQIFQE